MKNKYAMQTIGELSHLSTIPVTAHKFSYQLVLSNKDAKKGADKFLNALQRDLKIIEQWIEEIKENEK